MQLLDFCFQLFYLSILSRNLSLTNLGSTILRDQQVVFEVTPSWNFSRDRFSEFELSDRKWFCLWLHYSRFHAQVAPSSFSPPSPIYWPDSDGAYLFIVSDDLLDHLDFGLTHFQFHDAGSQQLHLPVILLLLLGLLGWCLWHWLLGHYEDGWGVVSILAVHLLVHLVWNGQEESAIIVVCVGQLWLLWVWIHCTEIKLKMKLNDQKNNSQIMQAYNTNMTASYKYLSRDSSAKKTDKSILKSPTHQLSNRASKKGSVQFRSTPVELHVPPMKSLNREDKEKLIATLLQ